MTTANPPRGPSDPIEAERRGVIDVDDALERVMGDRSLYARMLARFRSDWDGAAGRIRAALAGGQRELATSLAHTLHGAAGMIGAHELGRQAGALEAALRDASPAADGLIDALESAADRVLEQLEIELRNCSPEPAATLPCALLDDAALLTELADLLASGDGAAIDLIETSAVSLKSMLGEAGWAQVRQVANEFDFDDALLALRRLNGAA